MNILSDDVAIPLETMDVIRHLALHGTATARVMLGTNLLKLKAVLPENLHEDLQKILSVIKLKDEKNLAYTPNIETFNTTERWESLCTFFADICDIEDIKKFKSVEERYALMYVLSILKGILAVKSTLQYPDTKDAVKSISDYMDSVAVDALPEDIKTELDEQLLNITKYTAAILEYEVAMYFKISIKNTAPEFIKQAMQALEASTVEQLNMVNTCAKPFPHNLLVGDLDTVYGDFGMCNLNKMPYIYRELFLRMTFMLICSVVYLPMFALRHNLDSVKEDSKIIVPTIKVPGGLVH